jgi:hypothetical protein
MMSVQEEKVHEGLVWGTGHVPRLVLFCAALDVFEYIV